ncbi:MAG: DUF4835 family protein [Bacteroidales bacterium]
MRKILFVFLFSFLVTNFVDAQEFFCKVSVNSKQIQGSDRKIFDAMEKAIYEFMNNKKWSGYKFKPEERIECNILLTIDKMPAVDEFSGKLNIALRRPVYKSSYNTVLFNYIDPDVHFRFNEFEPLKYYDNTYTDNLSSILAFYSYFFLGLDFDSFKLYGGNPFFKKAENVVSVAQSANEKGWKSFDGNRNRYWLVENFLNEMFKPIRKFSYEYHLKGLDVMSEDVVKGRANIAKNIPELKKIYDKRPGQFIFQILFDAKRNEIINIFSDATPNEKTSVTNIMKEIDPSHSSDYNKILKSK